MSSNNWSRVLVELFDENGYQGHWEVSPTGGGPFDRAAVTRVVQQIGRVNRYKNAHLAFCEEQGDCIIGVFCNREPPTDPGRGTVLPSGMFDE